MEALAVRLSGLDSYAEGAVRVIAFYDTLMRRRVDLPALARSSAALAECAAGIRIHGTGRVAGRGRRRLGRPAAVGRDADLLDRLAIAAAAVLERYGPARTALRFTTPRRPSSTTTSRGRWRCSRRSRRTPCGTTPT